MLKSQLSVESKPETLSLFPVFIITQKQEKIVMAIQLNTRKFTISEYHHIAETGILLEDERIELIKGEIIQMSPIGSRHAASVRRLTQLFSQKLGQNALISVQNPIFLGDDISEPQPDLAIVSYRDDFYLDAHPQPQDILLLIEIADSSLTYDREVKAPLYAAAGITELWLVNLIEQRLEIYRQPAANGYQEIKYCKYCRKNDSISSLAFPDISLTVAEILG